MQVHVRRVAVISFRKAELHLLLLLHAVSQSTGHAHRRAQILLIKNQHHKTF